MIVKGGLFVGVEVEPQYAHQAGYACAWKALSGAEQGVGEKRGTTWGLRNPTCTVVLGPAKDRRELVFCPSHTWYLQMPGLSGIRKVKNNILSYIIQVFSRLMLLKLDCM